MLTGAGYSPTSAGGRMSSSHPLFTRTGPDRYRLVGQVPADPPRRATVAAVNAGNGAVTGWRPGGVAILVVVVDVGRQILQVLRGALVRVGRNPRPHSTLH